MNALKTVQLLPLACVVALAQPQPAFQFDAQVWPNAAIGGYVFDSATKIDTIALSDSGAVAFTAHRDNGGTGRDDTAVFTKERVVARERQMVDGKIIIRIATAVVGVNNANQVAFEALYLVPGHSELHAGVFVENRLDVEFEPPKDGKASPFLLADDGIARLAEGAKPPKARKSYLTYALRATIRVYESQLESHIPRGSYPDLWGGAVNIGDIIIWDKINGAPTPKRSHQASVNEARACPPPAFPTPSQWSIGAVSSANIVANLYEDGTPARSYDSPIYGHIVSPFRQIQFDRSCAPQVITVGDKRGHLEAQTPRGLLTYEKPDGTLDLPGFYQNAAAGSFIASDVSFAINAKGQIAIRIVVDGGGAVLLATPVLAKP